MMRLVTIIGVGTLVLLLAGAVVGGATPTRAGTSEPEFIELGHYGVWKIDTFDEGSQGRGDTCEEVEPGVTECTYAITAKVNGTLIGQATEIQTGTTRREPCVQSDGTPATATTTEAGGTITTQSGDLLFYHAPAIRTCGSDYRPWLWTVVGGTGRFEDASGTISDVFRDEPGVPGPTGNGIITVGTLRVRADRFAEYFGDEPAPMIRPGSAWVTEGDSGQVVVDVPVTLSFTASTPITVDWTTLDTGDPGIATADVDYVSASGTLTFAPGEFEKTVSITVNGDTEDEPPAYLGEWVVIELSNPSPNAVLGGGFIDGYGIGIVVDDD